MYHAFIHTYLDTILKNWYTELEVRIGTVDWEEFMCNFKVTLSFEDDAPSVDTTPQISKRKINRSFNFIFLRI